MRNSRGNPRSGAESITGLTETVGIAALPDYFRDSFEPALASLLDAAAATGEIRDGVTPYDLLRAIGNLSEKTELSIHGTWLIY